MARFHIGLPAAEFRSLTLRQITKLMDLKRKQSQQDAERFGMVCATVANFAMVENRSKVYRASDFFDVPDPKPERMSDQAMLSVMMGIYKAQQKKANAN